MTTARNLDLAQFEGYSPPNTSQYFAAPEDFGCYSCADDYEEAQRNRCPVIEEEMP